MSVWGARAPIQHSPVQRSVPQCVSSEYVSHPAGYPACYSTPVSTRLLKYKYTNEELFALAAPVHLKPKPITTLKKLGIGRRWALDVRCSVAGRAAVVHGKSEQFLWWARATLAADLIVTFHLQPRLLLSTTTFLTLPPPPPPHPFLGLVAIQTI